MELPVDIYVSRCYYMIKFIRHYVCTSLVTSSLVMAYSPRLVTRPGLLILMLLTAWAMSTLPSLLAMSQARAAPHHTPAPVTGPIHPAANQVEK